MARQFRQADRFTHGVHRGFVHCSSGVYGLTALTSVGTEGLSYPSIHPDSLEGAFSEVPLCIAPVSAEKARSDERHDFLAVV